MDFSVNVPGTSDARKGLKIKLTKIVVAFEEWQSEINLDWTVSYNEDPNPPSSDPEPEPLVPTI